MAVTVVDVVNVPVVRHGNVLAALPVAMGVAGVLVMRRRGALVDMSLVDGVHMAVVGVVRVALMGERDVAAALAVDVGVISVLEMGGSHRFPPASA